MSGEIVREVEPINGKTGGDSVLLSVDLFDNGDAKVGLPNGFFTNISLSLQCYGSHSTEIHLSSTTLDNIINACEKLKEKIEKAKVDYLSSFNFNHR